MDQGKVQRIYRTKVILRWLAILATVRFINKANQTQERAQIIQLHSQTKTRQQAI